MASPKSKTHGFSLKLNPPSKNAEGGCRFANKKQCVLGGPKSYITKSGALKIKFTHRGFVQCYTILFQLHENHTGSSPVHYKVTTDSSSPKIMRSNSSITLRTATSIISSAKLRRYSSNPGPAIKYASCQSP